MREGTFLALTAAAAEHGFEIEIAIDEPDRFELELVAIDWSDENESRYVERRLTAHRLANGRWINAQWDARHAQWRSSDILNMERIPHTLPTCHVFSTTLGSLVGAVHTYHTPGQALLSVIRDLGAGA
jgi:hypothetical protein